MRCDAEGYTTPVFSSLSIYMKLWKTKHLPVVPVNQCLLCSSRFGRRCEVTRHLRFYHHYSVEMAKECAAGLQHDQLTNMNFKDLGEVLPRRTKSRVNEEAREAARRQREAYLKANRVEFPNFFGAITVPRDNVDYVFDVPSVGQRLQLTNKPGCNKKRYC
ncbi:unnamed protein product [Mytilus coruscus]|uniref:Uncharacterized protein n=1 Tax=Mytilus coruscus TaxID=42192 RepID=A0A6J8E0J7_MYTCO|nr:unnamed protein product [Mytilus coruscus]